MKRLFYSLVAGFALLFSVSSCHHDKTTTPPVPPAGSIVVYSNVHIIDSTQWILHSTTNGVYQYTFTPNTPNVSVKVGDVIVGTTNGGYIRKVTNVAISGQFYVLTTQQGTMADVFKSGSFTVQIPINDPNQSGGVTRTVNNFRLYHTSSYEVVLNHGEFFVQPTINATFAFDSTGLTNFQLSAPNTNYSDTAMVLHKGMEPYSWSHDTTVAAFNTTSINWVQAFGNINVPIVMQLNLSVLAKCSGGSANYWSTQANTVSTWVSNSVFTSGLQYSGGNWQPITNNISSGVAAIDSGGVSADIRSNVQLITQLATNFYGVGGPVLTIGTNGGTTGTDRYPPGFSRGTTAAVAGCQEQIVHPVFDKNIPTYSNCWTADTVLYQTPYQLTLIAGNNQTGNIISTLPEPIVVRLSNSDGSPVKNYKVTFTVASGGGQLGSAFANSLTLNTDQNGLAQTIWSLGPLINTQTVKVTCVDGGNANFVGSPIIFSATGQ